jgi:hypothetical protein
MASLLPLMALAAKKNKAPEPDPLEAYVQVALVTAAWLIMAYLMLPWGPTANLTGRHKYQVKWGDRSFMNMVEQAPFFLTSLWLCAVFCSPDKAANLGKAYLILRALYPLIWAAKGTHGEGAPFPSIFISTFPQYGVIAYMTSLVAAKHCCGTCLTELFGGYDTIGAIVFTVGFFVYALTITPVLQTTIYASFFPTPPAKSK